MKLFATLALLTSLLFPTPPCATVVLALGQASVAQGGTQSITTDVTNCDTKKAKFAVTVTVTDAIGNITLLRNDIRNYNANETITHNDVYPVVANAPLGTYRVMSIVFLVAGGSTTEIARDEETFEVVP